MTEFDRATMNRAGCLPKASVMSTIASPNNAGFFVGLFLSNGREAILDCLQRLRQVGPRAPLELL